MKTRVEEHTMHAPENRIATSVLVIGTGGAGLRAAIELAEHGVDVLAVGKRPKADAHTSLAAGGINAALDVPILDSVYITRLLVRDNAVFGAYGFDLTD
ncbi:FAD-binding protein, partial [Nonomuraea sp. NPDC049714]|uniref:FAD-binding protein n=1 Tax=Nonomuraea sp. NPDC049714 TaxID=3364357 RepID=UPI003788550C